MTGYRRENVVGSLVCRRIRSQVVDLEIEEQVARLVAAVFRRFDPFFEYTQGIGQYQQAVLREPVLLLGLLYERGELQVAHRKLRRVKRLGDKGFLGFAGTPGIEVGHDGFRPVRSRGDARDNLFQYYSLLAPPGDGDGPIRLVFPFLNRLEDGVVLLVDDGQIDLKGGDVDTVISSFKGKSARTAQEVEFQESLSFLPPEAAHVHGKVDFAGAVRRHEKGVASSAGGVRFRHGVGIRIRRSGILLLRVGGPGGPGDEQADQTGYTVVVSNHFRFSGSVSFRIPVHRGKPAAAFNADLRISNDLRIME